MQPPTGLITIDVPQIRTLVPAAFQHDAHPLTAPSPTAWLTREMRASIARQIWDDDLREVEYLDISDEQFAGVTSTPLDSPIIDLIVIRFGITGSEQHIRLNNTDFEAGMDALHEDMDRVVIEAGLIPTTWQHVERSCGLHTQLRTARAIIEATGGTMEYSFY